MSFADQPIKQRILCQNCGHSQSVHIHESYQWDDENNCEAPIYECDLCDCVCFAPQEGESSLSKHCDSGWMNQIWQLD